jgi:hypothetical protein
MKLSEILVTERTSFARRKVASSMVLRGYKTGPIVTPFLDSTSVLRSRNARPIGRKDRWWQYCAIRRTVAPLDVCAVEVHGSC